MRDAESRFADSTHSGMRAWRRLPVVAALLVIASLSAGASSASAAYTHVPGPEFGSEGAPPGEFPCCVYGMAFNQASKRLLVGTQQKIYGFDVSVPGSPTQLAGSFPFNNVSYGGGIGVDNSFTATNGNIYSAPGFGPASGYGSDGTALPGWPLDPGPTVCGAGVDGEGNVWLTVDGGVPAAKEFAPTGGASIGSFTRNPSSGGSCRIAMDVSTDDIYLSRYTGAVTGAVFRYTKASNYATSEQVPNNPFANAPLTVNAVNDRLYITKEDTGTEVLAIDTTTGNVVETIPILSGVRELAVNEADDTLYIVRNSSPRRVQEYRASGGPKATTEVQANPKTTAVSGIANPNGNGPITQCYFEYGTPGSALSKQNCAETLPISSSQGVTANLSGVEGEHVYGYRLVVTNGEPGAAAAGDFKKLLLHNVQGVANDAASEVARNSAKLNAHFEGTNEATTYYFEYGTTKAYGSRFPTGVTELPAGTTTGNTPISAVVPGLTAQTKYHYRVVTKNAKGTTVGPGDVEFETPPAVGSIGTDEVTEITQTSATLNGSYDASTVDFGPEPGESYFYYFEWGTDTSYGNETATPPGVDNGIHSGIVHVSAPITGLTKYVPTTPTPYHFRIVVSNGHGTTYGPDRIFHSAPADPPGISGVAAGGVTPTEASISASVNPNGAPTTYVVEYGVDSSYGSSTVESASIGEDEEAHPVGATLEGLSPGTTYHFRVVAANFGGTSHSPDQTFTTPDVPLIESSDALSVGETSAHLRALVIPHSSATGVNFEYGRDETYGSGTAPAFIGSGVLSQETGADIGGLAPGTTYHFRVVAINGIGTAAGPDRTFTTQSPPVHEEEKKPPKCPKGKVKRHGKCVKRHRKTHRKHGGGRRNG